MKLFQPREAGKYVYAVTAKKSSPGQAAQYVAVQAGDHEGAETALSHDGLVNCYPHPMGRYDEQGRYCTYKPPIDGIAAGRYVLHPLAYQEWLAYEKGVY